MRDYESISSIETFLKCPMAYRLSYVECVPAKVSPQVEFGKFIHSQLERWAKNEPVHDSAIPFIKALENFLEEEGLIILSPEHEFKIYIDGQQFKGVIDALCNNGVALEYKITSAPDNFKNKISYQLALYSHYLRPRNLKLVYLLFEVDKNFNLIKLHPEHPPVSDLLIEQRLKELLTAVKMIKTCYENDCFPPSWNGCRWCFYKDVCNEYFGG